MTENYHNCHSWHRNNNDDETVSFGFESFSIFSMFFALGYVTNGGLSHDSKLLLLFITAQSFCGHFTIIYRFLTNIDNGNIAAPIRCSLRASATTLSDIVGSSGLNSAPRLPLLNDFGPYSRSNNKIILMAKLYHTWQNN